MSIQTSTIDSHSKDRLWTSTHECAVCGSKAIGTNFGAPTCAPCKAFFRRNARRREVLQIPCQILNSDGLTNENKEQYNNNYCCPQLRRCTSCRLRRCYDVGMKEELVRTDEEKQRYKQLIERNRQKKREILKLQETTQIIPKIIVTNDELLNENDWRLLSNIVYAYDNYCLKIFTQNRQDIFHNENNIPEQSSSKINHHIVTRLNNMKSFLSFISSIPVIQLLSNSNRFYLCKHNIRSLIFPNLHEIEQTCFTESSQLNVNDAAAEYVYGKPLFNNLIRVKNLARSILINDSVVTRLWLLILYLSTPLLCYYDSSSPEISNDDRIDIYNIQNTFTILLWNYLIHRHGYFGSVQIFSNFIYIYLQMQQITQEINHQVRTRSDLAEMNQAFNRVVVMEHDFS